MAGDIDIDALIAASSHTRQSRYCWASPEQPEPIPERSRDYLEALTEIDLNRISPTQVSRLLAENWDLDISREQVRRHLAGECQCRK